MRVRLRFVPQDLWVGAYWDRDRKRLYVCLVPCLPIVLAFSVPCPSSGDAGCCNGYLYAPGAPKGWVTHYTCRGTGRVFL